MKIAEILNSLPSWVRDNIDKEPIIRDYVQRMALGHINRYRFFEALSEVYFKRYSILTKDLAEISKEIKDTATRMKASIETGE